MKYILCFLLSLLTGSLILYSCANRSVPTGGPKDTIPPILIKVTPPNKSLNFNQDQVVLTFNEFIKTKDINNQLIITPRLTEENEYKVNKYTLTIQLNEKLDSNTTYTFNFQESVQDITESTPAKDLVIAFSTGDYIDSLFIEGFVYDLLTAKPMENAVVALYPAGDTLDLFNSKPQYFTKTKKDGSYRLENLKNANYRIYAFSDNNKNLTAQSDSEPYGFIADSIVLDTVISGLNIPLLKRNVKEFKLQSARPSGKYFEIKLSKYIEDYNLKVISGEPDSLISNLLPDQNIIRIYNTITSDSIETEVNAIDTIGQSFVDTVFVKFPETQRKSDPITYSIIPSSGASIEEDYSAVIKFNKPIAEINLDSAFFYYDSLTVDSIKKEDITWNKFKDKLTLQKRLEKKLLEKTIPAEDSLSISVPDTVETKREETELPTQRDKKALSRQDKDEQPPPKSKFDKQSNQVLLYLASGTFKSVENDTIPRISASYSFKKNEDMGLIKGTITTDKENYFIQLLNKSYELVKEIKGSEKFTFNMLQPGEYQLRILIDNNGNGVWDPGNILENEPPEDVHFYKEPIIIRANWERELDDIDLSPVDYSVENTVDN